MKASDRMVMVGALLVCVGAWGCGDNDNSVAEPTPSAALQCEVLGSLCHDSETVPGEECHHLGHDGRPDACVAGFSGCLDVCLEHGAGEDPFCRAIGSLCHDADSAAAETCHDLGHDGDPAACRREFDACAQLCLAESEASAAVSAERRGTERPS